MSTLYVNVDTDVTITPSGILVADIATMTLTLTKGATSKAYSLGSEIAVVGSDFVLSIPDSGVKAITEAGEYDIVINLTDTSGAIRRLTPSPSTLSFHA